MQQIKEGARIRCVDASAHEGVLTLGKIYVHEGVDDEDEELIYICNSRHR